jgi:ATP-binding cassette, subfamily B, bacterial MsbA
MKDLFRASKPILRHRFTLAAAICCSFLASALWGANIGTLYPFVEVIFRGESLQATMTQKIEVSQREASRLREEITELNQQLEAGAGPERTEIARELDSSETRLTAEMRTIEKTTRNRRYVEKVFPNDPFQTLVVVVAGLLVMTLLKSFFLVANQVLVAWMTQKGVFELENELFQRTIHLDVSTFGEDRASKLMSSFTHRMQKVGNALSTMFGQAIREPLKLFVCLIGAAIVSWRLLLVSLVLAPVGILLLHGLTRLIRRGSTLDMDLVANIYRRLSEAFFGISTVKIFGQEDHEIEKFRDVTHRLLKRRRKNAFIMALATPISETMAIGIISIAMLTSSYLILNRETHLFGIRMCSEPLSPAAMMVFFGMLAGVSDPARKMSRIYGQLFFGASAAKQIFRLMDRTAAIQDPAEPVPIPLPLRELQLTNVSFKYTGGQPVLKNVNLTVQSGEKLAIVGVNGCGKSTLIKLIPRILEPRRGSICWNGVDLRDLSLKELRQQIGMVTQETWLFDDSVMNNIRYGNPDASDMEVIHAAKMAGIHEIVLSFSEGYETPVGERGCFLSGGQRQRIALARAILKNPAILVLDEATSDIDAEAEQLIHSELEQFAHGRTLIMVTHRVASLAIADRVVLMDGGRIIDIGSHAELIARCKPYHRWHAVQQKAAA